MPTHVHVLATPLEGHKLSHILHSWKSYSAKAANRALNRNGAFWDPEYFDHVVCDDFQFEAALAYIDNNPVSAGLCQNAEDWPFSCARRRRAL